MTRGLLGLAVLGAAISGCMFTEGPIPRPNDGVGLALTKDALSYRSPLPHDVAGAATATREAHGKSCRTTLSFPPSPQDPFYGSNLVLSELPWNPVNLEFKDSSFAKALAKAGAEAASGKLFDVRADVHTTSILGIWTKSCTEVVARVGE